ncbi:MAG: hypothetical protein A2Y88_09670 [Chloroflexi bacterium RBG_13_48_10]|nr:MAG: hypothetical protein A2Y88_09670 [Chloroflexi bacterium RBG_13_48_10]
MRQTTSFWNLVILGLLVLLGLNNLQSQTKASAQSTATIEGSCDSSRTVHVSGAAVVYVTPDRVLLQLGVQSNGTSPDAVRKDNSQDIQHVIQAVTTLGVQAKDIATDYYLVYPVYEDFSSLVIKGYRIDNTVSITLRDISLVDDAIITALKSGANEIQDVQFYSSELRKYRDQARGLAMKAAGEKAEALADEAGAQAGCLLTISENTWSQYYGSWRGGRETALWAQNVIQNTSSSQGDLTQMDDSPITLGQIAIRAEVNASYSLTGG